MNDLTKVRDVQASLFPNLAPDKPIGKILSSVFAGTNADLMAAVAPYYLAGSVCDVTYGEGKWWDRYMPEPFVAHDKFKGDGVDFTALPEADDTYDTVCFDPPYTVSGGVSSEALGDRFQSRYGIGINATPPDAPKLTDLILDGVDEVCRVARGFVLVKCMEFAQGGKFHDIPHLVTDRARSVGWHKHDLIVHHTGSGPGGHNIFDPKRARRHHSYLLVFRKDPRA